MSRLIDTQLDGNGDIILSRNDVEIARVDGAGNVATKGTVNGGSISAIFNVKQTYGAVGDGVTDDTAAINRAIAAINAAGGGILYFPQGNYVVSSTLTTISVPCWVLGSAPIINGSSISATQTATDIFVVNSDAVTFENLRIAGPGATATAGACIHVQSGFSVRLNHVRIGAHWICAQFDDGAYGYWIGGASYLINFVKYGVYRPYGGTNADRGDDMIVGCTIDSSIATTGSACIYFEAHGGLKVGNTKLLRADYGILGNIADGAATSDCLVGDDVSIENQNVNNINIARSGTTGTFAEFHCAAQMTIASGKTNVVVGSGITRSSVKGAMSSSGVGVDVQGTAGSLYIGSNTFNAHATAIQVASTTTGVVVGPNLYNGVTTTVNDTGLVARRTPAVPDIVGERVGSASAVWTANMAILVPFRLSADGSIPSIEFGIGTASGNADVGVYDNAGNRVVSKGSTVCPSAGVGSLTLGANTLKSGQQYWLAVAFDNATVTVLMVGSSGANPGLNYQRKVTTAFPLPSSLTIGSTRPSVAVALSAQVTPV